MEQTPTTKAMNSGTIDSETFFRELMTFRKIMQDKRNSIDYMDRAHGCLFLITNRVDPKDPHKKKTEEAWATITEEFIRRKVLMVLNNHPLE